MTKKRDGENMKIIIKDSYESMSDAAFSVMKEVLSSVSKPVLGLATGTTPIGLYDRMIRDHRENGTSYRNVTTVNLDEYIGLGSDHDQSYAYFMRDRLLSHLDVAESNINIENGLAEDAEKECKRYDSVLEKYPRDIQLLGLGENGHIAFNEPWTPFDSRTHTVRLTESTILANSRLFDRLEDVPRSAFTMGIKDIMDAKIILILANGEKKADAVRRMVKGEVTEEVPASILQRHPKCILITDGEAAAEIL